MAAIGGLYLASALPVAWPGDISAGPIAASLLLGLALVWLSAIDLQTFRLPDALTLPLIAAGIAAAALSDIGVPWAAASALLGFALLYGVMAAYRRLRGQDGIGLGDAKLLAASGAWLGAEALGTVLLYACGGALASVLVAAASGSRITRDTRLPFGPFLAFATWIVWLYGPV